MTMDFSSSSFNDSYLNPNVSSKHLPIFMNCFLSEPSSFVFTAYSVINVLLFLPLCIFVFQTALLQWRSASPVAATRHSDGFIYNLVVMELISVAGSFLCCYGLHSRQLSVLNIGCLVFSFSWYGQAISHILVSVEGYLATVHPVTYMSLRKRRGARFRNAEIVCSWLLSFAGMSLVMFDSFFIVMDFALLMLSFAVIFFCSLSVLLVLIRPGPGQQGGVRKRFDQLKRRALRSVVVILEVLSLRFIWNLAWVAMFISGSAECLVLMGCTFSSLPSNLVLPLLFLRREGKLVCCSNDAE
ncbi:PREDICTED: uncharacterized protein LOC106905412 [Poecilia mexicana]|uniref:uncharacterized protein LOC106905412 n=1 Tax=Poecilia mexicana TaxID=48701 RepID=UPI00072DECAE|nr:PREDICTED: uncharacterized protein LOC106905412 [Poecilia mexicana]XP_014825742.1 PREDICTED: uncharacterized protein LOC106905412 [Poecilia mexicana]